MKRNLKLFSLLFILVGIISGCASVNHESEPILNGDDTRGLSRETGRAFLVEDQKEAKGYGLYSYLLFSTPPTDANSRDQYLQAITNYVNMISTVRDLEKANIPKKELNIVYLPLTLPPPPAPSAEWLLDHYNYARARALIRTIQGDLRDGPYIISTLKPLDAHNNENSKYIRLDLSHVPPPIISLWVKEFMTQAAKEHYWEEDTARRLVLNVRTTLEALAVGTKEVSTVLASNTVIALLEMKKGFQ